MKYVVLADGKVDSINESALYVTFNKAWAPLMPFIQDSYYNNKRLYKFELCSIEMGVYSIEENKKYNAPFVWNHIKIKAIEVISGEKKEFKADVVIYRQKYSHLDIYEHTFVVKNGVYFFLDSILGTINHLLDKGYSLEDINFDFLDKQCLMSYSLGANLRPDLKFELCSEFSKRGFYTLISTMNLEVSENVCALRNGDCHWLEIKLFLNTIDKYIVHVITTVLRKKASEHIKDLRTKLDVNRTIFSFTAREYSDDGPSCGSYARTITDDKILKEIREVYTMELLLEGAKMLDRDTAIEYLATKHKDDD